MSQFQILIMKSDGPKQYLLNYFLGQMTPENLLLLVTPISLHLLKFHGSKQDVPCKKVVLHFSACLISSISHWYVYTVALKGQCTS